MSNDIDGLIQRMKEGDDTVCPFDRKTSLLVTDPCPVCGDLGEKSDASSNCVGSSTRMLVLEAAAALCEQQQTIDGHIAVKLECVDRAEAAERDLAAARAEIADLKEWNVTQELAEARAEIARLNHPKVSAGKRSGALRTAIKEQKERAEQAEAERDALRTALQTSIVALDDWLNDFADTECDPVRVQAARERIHEYGTIAYIAKVQQANRAALDLPQPRHPGQEPREGEACQHEWIYSTDGVTSTMRCSHCAEIRAYGIAPREGEA